MRLVFSEGGIYVYPLFLFRAFHRPFLVPWDKVVEVKKIKGLFGMRYQLEVRDGYGEIHMELSQAGATAFEEHRLDHRRV